MFYKRNLEDTEMKRMKFNSFLLDADLFWHAVWEKLDLITWLTGGTFLFLMETLTSVVLWWSLVILRDNELNEDMSGPDESQD